MFSRAETECLPAGDELAARRRADGLNIVVLQPHALRRQFVQCGGLNGRVVVADIVETLEEKDGMKLSQDGPSRTYRLIKLIYNRNHSNNEERTLQK